MLDFIFSLPRALVGLAAEIRSPATVATNVLLAAQCVILSRRFTAPAPQASAGGSGSAGVGSRPAVWAGCFLLIGASAAFGAVKHGSLGLLDPTLHASIAATSNLALGGAVAALHAALTPSLTWVRILWAPTCVTAAAVSAMSGSFELFGLAVGLGMAPVVLTSTEDAIRARPGGAWMLAAWSVAALAGWAWIAGPSPAPWFRPIDVAHLILLVSLALVARGASARMVGREARHPRPTRPDSSTGTAPSGS